MRCLLIWRSLFRSAFPRGLFENGISEEVLSVQENARIRYSHLLRVNFQIQIIGSDDITYQRLQCLANMDSLLGPNVVKSDVDIYRMSMNYICGGVRVLHLLCYGELELMLLP